MTLPYAQPSKTLSITVTPQGRAGYPPVLVYLSVAPPGGMTQTTTPTATIAPRPVLGLAPTLPSTSGRARFVGPVTLRLVRGGRTRVGSRLAERADVRGERRLRYRWRRDGRAIDGTARSTYMLRRGDHGRRISCRLTATGSDGVAVRRTSASRPIRRR